MKKTESRWTGFQAPYSCYFSAW